MRRELQGLIVALMRRHQAEKKDGILWSAQMIAELLEADTGEVVDALRELEARGVIQIANGEYRLMG